MSIKFLEKLSQEPIAILGSFIVIVILAGAIFGPLLSPHEPTKQNLQKAFIPPNFSHLFGTDSYGRDIFSRALHGIRLSLFIGISTVVFGALIGVPIGIISGFLGGHIDNLVMRFMDIILSFPPLILAMAISVGLGAGLTSAVTAVVFASIAPYARLSRSEVLSLREETYVEAAKALGRSKQGIMWKHIFPNSISTVVVRMTLNIGSSILIVSSLSFLGFGAQEPTPELGLLITTGRHYIVTGQWWLSLLPGLTLALIVFGFNLVGDFLRDYLNPRLREQ